MNVQAVPNELAELPASGTHGAEGEAPEGAEFDAILSHAQSQGDAEAEEQGGEAEEEALAAAAAETARPAMAPNGRALPLIESLVLGLRQTLREAAREVNTGARTPAAAQAPMGELPHAAPAAQGQALPLIESLALGLRASLDEGVRSGLQGVASQAPSTSEPLPTPNAGSAIPAPVALGDAVRSEAPASDAAPPPLPTPAVPERGPQTTLPGEVAAAQLGASGGGDRGASDADTPDASLGQPTGLPRSDASAPGTTSGDFAATLESTREAGPAPALAPAAPTPSPTAVEAALAQVAPPGPASSAPVHAAGAPEEVLPVHVEWLAARQGGNARISLHPPELGELELAVRVRGSAVDITIRAQDPAAQLAAAQSRELLEGALAGRELRIDQFEVRGLQSELGREDHPAQTGSQAQQDASARRGDREREGGGEPATPFAASSGREAADGPSSEAPPHAEVDLRI